MPAGDWYATTRRINTGGWWGTDPSPTLGTAGWSITSGGNRRVQLLPAYGDYLTFDANLHVVRPFVSQDTNLLAVETSLAFQAISPPLAAQTLNTTVTVTAIHEGNTAATVRGAAGLFLVNSSGTLTNLLKPTQQADASMGVGIGTWSFAISFGTVGPHAVSAGDRLVLEGGMANNSVGSTINWPVYWNDNSSGTGFYGYFGRAKVAFSNVPTLLYLGTNAYDLTQRRNLVSAVRYSSSRSRIYSFAKSLSDAIPDNAVRPANLGWELERASFMLRSTNLRTPDTHNPDERNGSGFAARQVPLLDVMPTKRGGGGLGVDAVPPQIGTPTPASGTITRTTSVFIPITDNVELGQITCWVTYASSPKVEMVYDGAAFSALFDDFSSLSGSGNSKTLAVRRDNPGWLDSPTIHLRVADSSGNEVTDSFSYTVSGYPFMPALSNVSPANGSSIARTAPVSFDVSDDVALSLVTVHVSYPSAPEADVAYTGAAFGPRFDAGSTLTPITGGSSFVIQPDGNGWRDSPTITIRATDPDGNPLGAVISYTLSGASYPFSPTIQNLTPSDGDVTPDEYISFDVVSDDGLAACVVLARFADLVIDEENSISMYEVVWDGTQLGDMYKTHSVSTPIAKGRHFALRRFGGWRVGVTFKTVSVSAEGQAG